MSEKNTSSPIVALQGELKAQQRLVEQITAGAAPVISSISLKKEFSSAISQLSIDVQKLTLNATKNALSAGTGRPTADIMLDTFDAINALVRKYEIFMLESLISATVTSSASKQIVEKVEADVKESRSKIEAFQRIQESGESSRSVGARPEKIRRQRQYASALDDVERVDET